MKRITNPPIKYLSSIFLVWYCLTTQTFASEYELRPFEAEYIAYVWGDPLGKATMKLESLQHNHYSLLYQSQVSKFFLSDKRTEHSIFKLDNHALAPKEYHYSRTGTGKDKVLDVTFNLNNQQMSISNNKSAFELPWEGEIDNQLYRLQISEMLADGKIEFDIKFINYRGDKKSYTFAVERDETLSLPYGSLDTIKVKIKRNKGSRETFAWFAPTLNYQLVRLQQFKDGKEQGDIKLSKFTLLE